MSRIRDSYDIARSKGLGRIPHADPRSSLYRMNDYLRPALVGTTLPEKKLWTPGKVLDQGQEGSCVGHGWTAWNNARPRGHEQQKGHEFAVKWYHTAQENDPWPGEDYEGTATVAGAKVGRMWGLLEAWVNATSADDVYAFLGLKGGVVLGTVWKESMDHMKPGYFLEVDLSSRTRGGHCYFAQGYLEDETVVCQNSWGDDYGDEGFFYLKRPDFEKLLYANGDAIGAIQTGIPPR